MTANSLDISAWSRLRVLVPVLVATVHLAGCALSKPLEPLYVVPPGPHNVLFVGNSLTYTNNLPGTLVALATMSGDTVYAASETAANVALIDHLTGSTNAVAAIRHGGWEYVVLQQGPTPPGICRDSLVLWTRMFDSIIKQANGKTAVLMVWPLAGPLTWFPDISASFVAAASAVNGSLFPGGEAWRVALTDDPTIALYSADGLHPSPVGTYLTALVIYERVTGRDARTLPPKAIAAGRDLHLLEAAVRALQRAAHQANTTYPAAGGATPGARIVKPASLTPLAQVGHC